jgi:hypothetical protein
MSSTRRIFLANTLGLCAALAFARESLAEQGHLSESDPAAQALGYRTDATKVDKVKFAKYQPGESCSNCQFYRGKAGEAFGGCPMFGARDVAAGGWCNAYAKRA